jgi:deoxyuridine 5''-triphosphate nucleotidohydrolase (EC 3.6.1.23)
MLIDVRILDTRMQNQLPEYATPGAAGLDYAPVSIKRSRSRPAQRN